MARRRSKADEVAKIFKDALKRKKVAHGPIEAETMPKFGEHGWDFKHRLMFTATVMGEDVPVTVMISEAKTTQRSGYGGYDTSPPQASGSVDLPHRYGGTFIRRRITGADQVDDVARQMASDLASHLHREKKTNPRAIEYVLGDDAYGDWWVWVPVPHRSGYVEHLPRSYPTQAAAERRARSYARKQGHKITIRVEPYDDGRENNPASQRESHARLLNPWGTT